MQHFPAVSPPLSASCRRYFLVSPRVDKDFPCVSKPNHFRCVCVFALKSPSATPRRSLAMFVFAVGQLVSTNLFVCLIMRNIGVAAAGSRALLCFLMRTQSFLLFFFCCSVLCCLFPTCHCFVFHSPFFLFLPLTCHVTSCDFDSYWACMVLMMSLQTAEGNSSKIPPWILTPNSPHSMCTLTPV